MKLGTRFGDICTRGLGDIPGARAVGVLHGETSRKWRDSLNLLRLNSQQPTRGTQLSVLENYSGKWERNRPDSKSMDSFSRNDAIVREVKVANSVCDSK